MTDLRYERRGGLPPADSIVLSGDSAGDLKKRRTEAGGTDHKKSLKNFQ